jgi:DNA-binding NtrC family response regulator
LTRPCILLVDDNDDVRQVLCEQLLSAGYDVRQSKDTETAHRLFEQDNNVQLLLSDFRLEEKKTGVELAIELQLKMPNLPVLIITGYPDEAKVASAGRFNVLAKPVHKSSLIASVQAAIKRQ